MVLIIHGDHQSASRDYLHRQIQLAKAKDYEIINLAGKKLDLNQLIVAVESGSMFQSHKLVIIENFFSRPKSAQKQAITDYLTQNIDHLPHLIFWEPKSVNLGRLKLKNLSKVKLFKLPALIFSFLDKFHFQQPLPPNEPVELIFYLLHRRISDLIIIKDDPSQLKKAPWQLNQLRRQADNFSLEKLISLHQQLLEIDYSIKSGQTPHSLPVLLDIFLAKL